MKIAARTFGRLFRDALKRGERGLDDAIDLYLWAREHHREIRKVSPRYKVGDTVSEIKRVFNVEPEVYIRTACRLAGGATQTHANTGRTLIKKIGCFETFRADNILTTDQMKRVMAKVRISVSPESFRKLVDSEYKKGLASQKGGGIPVRGSRMDYRKEYFKLLQKVASLDARLKEKEEFVVELKKENTWLKRQVGSKTKARKRQKAKK